MNIFYGKPKENKNFRVIFKDGASSSWREDVRLCLQSCLRTSLESPEFIRGEYVKEFKPTNITNASV